MATVTVSEVNQVGGAGIQTSAYAKVMALFLKDRVGNRSSSCLLHCMTLAHINN